VNWFCGHQLEMDADLPKQTAVFATRDSARALFLLSANTNLESRNEAAWPPWHQMGKDRCRLYLRGPRNFFAAEKP